ncbi:hypothetical protein Tc00.1047053511215.30 [Trypanosoma cruzi]|uniref:Uncharacterized protein n=1 Tax=Trypanosoma cruzi (strain CL Brener) TaxID=353153 RepID=Q4DIG4_TRYCC|nr:hypothetical protein Tc00.1047053511215.30 [Trypanosoma cruzi]EAN92310.1 hypothetical protein Tc00.1047053511215.30 [Trypanosoma cruzi]|eukprot:XP_814161.1 hypothetical protein [Trypanosoma cruzi strain CL Brener]
MIREWAMSSVFSLLDKEKPASSGVWSGQKQQQEARPLLWSRHGDGVRPAVKTNVSRHETGKNVGLNESHSVFGGGGSSMASCSLLSHILHRMLREADGIATDEVLAVARTIEKTYLHKKEFANTDAGMGVGVHDGGGGLLGQLIQEQLMLIRQKKRAAGAVMVDDTHRRGRDVESLAGHLLMPSPSLSSNNLPRPNFATYDEMRHLEVQKDSSLPCRTAFTPAALTAVPVLRPVPASRALYPVVVMTTPTFSLECQKVSVFVTIEQDIFYGIGVLRCMAPESYRHGGAGFPLARQPFRWFLARAAELEHIPRNTPLISSRSSAPPFVCESLLEQWMQQDGGDTFVPLDSLIAIGVASSRVLSSSPPIMIGLEIDLNPDHDLDHMQAVEATLLQRYWTLRRKESSGFSMSHACLEEGVPYVVGVEVYFGDGIEDDDSAETWVAVLRDFVIPKGSHTGRTERELRNLLVPPQRRF